MSKEEDKTLTSKDYFEIIQCINHCVDDLNKMRFVATTEWERLTNLKFKLECAYNAARKAETK